MEWFIEGITLKNHDFFFPSFLWMLMLLTCAVGWIYFLWHSVTIWKIEKKIGSTLHRLWLWGASACLTFFLTGIGTLLTSELMGNFIFDEASPGSDAVLRGYGGVLLLVLVTFFAAFVLNKIIFSLAKKVCN